MFMDNGTEIPGLERTACVTYDQRSAESQGGQVTPCKAPAAVAAGRAAGAGMRSCRVPGPLLLSEPYLNRTPPHRPNAPLCYLGQGEALTEADLLDISEYGRSVMQRPEGQAIAHKVRPAQRLGARAHGHVSRGCCS